MQHQKTFHGFSPILSKHRESAQPSQSYRDIVRETLQKSGLTIKTHFLLKSCAVSLLIAGCMNVQAQAGYSTHGSPILEVPLFSGSMILGELTTEVKKGLTAQSSQVTNATQVAMIQTVQQIAAIDEPIQELPIHALEEEILDESPVALPAVEAYVEAKTAASEALKTDVKPEVKAAEPETKLEIKTTPVKVVTKTVKKPVQSATVKPVVKAASAKGKPAAKKPSILDNPIYLQIESAPADSNSIGTILDMMDDQPQADIKEIKEVKAPAPIKKAVQPAAKKPTAKVAAIASAPSEGSQYLMTEEEEEERLTMKLQSLALASAETKTKVDNRLAMMSSRKPTRGFSGLKGSTALLTIPIKGSYISSRFGQRWGRHHDGTDFAAPMGTSIYASASGTVVNSGWAGGYGNMILIDHGNGLKTLYGHCSKVSVATGQWVDQGDIIGKVGNTGHSTGPHLHYEILTNGTRINPETVLFR